MVLTRRQICAASAPFIIHNVTGLSFTSIIRRLNVTYWVFVQADSKIQSNFRLKLRFYTLISLDFDKFGLLIVVFDY